MRAQARMLPDRRRLHLQDGPIDLIIEAFGPQGEVEVAYRAAINRFQTVLDELCSELPFLRTPAMPSMPIPQGTVARRMTVAVAPYAEWTFITPMASVAGAVAEEILEAITSAAHVSKAYVNDGGDIALYLSPGTQFSVGMINRPDQPSLFGTAILHSDDAVRGIATSGWRGRSFSLGIADAVTVLARNASMADAAATIVANAVDLSGNQKVHRVSAHSICPDSDLGDLLVTRFVEELSREEVSCALDAGIAVAEQLRSHGLIHAAALHLQRETRLVTAAHELASQAHNANSRSMAHA